ncbi:MAG TPA: DUF5671 domain-containing protein [Candidatus Paceibacterota bacterium]
MDKPKVTPKDFFLWAGAMIALYASVVAFIALFFSYLDFVYPDQLAYYTPDPYASGVSYEMASLIVLFPIFMLISLAIIRDVRRDATRAEVWIRRWAIYLTLFVAGAAMAADLITLVMYFFNGDVTLRFVLKVLVVFLVLGGVFLHYLADLRGYWTHERSKALAVRWATSVLVVVSIVAGFFIIGTPWQAREYRFDEERINSLQQIQSQIVYYWQGKQQLPSTLADLTDTISGFVAPSDPQTGQPFTYERTGELSFKLCATFNAPTQQNAASRAYPMATTPYTMEKGAPADSWRHDAGEQCFTRTIDPALYPPLVQKTL